MTFATSPVLFRDSKHINISVARTSGLIPMTLSHQDKRNHLFPNPTKLLLPHTTEKQEAALEAIEPVATIDMSENEKRVMEAFYKAMILVCII